MSFWVISEKSGFMNMADNLLKMCKLYQEVGKKL